jgi:O-antigen/teichoic acid export membrane protein
MSVATTIAKNSLFQFFTSVLGTAAMFIVSVVLARYLGAEQYGVYSFMMWFLSLAMLIADMGVGEMTKRFVAEETGRRDPHATKGIIRLSLIVRGSVSLVVSLLIVGLSVALAGWFHMKGHQVYFMLVGAALFPYMLVWTLINVFAGFQKYEYSTWLELVVSPFRVALVIVLMALGYGVKEILIMYAAVWVAGLFTALVLTRRIVPLKDLVSPSLLEPSKRKDALKYSVAAMGLLGVDYVLWANAEVMFLGLYRPVTEVGFYNVAYKIPVVLVTLIPFVFGQVLLPTISEQFGRGDMDKIRRIYLTASRILMVLSFPLATVGIALARPTINLLFGAEYTPAIILMQIVLVPFALRGLTYAVSSVIYGIKEPAYLVKIGVVLVAVSLGLSFWLIPRYGAMGAVIATSIPRAISLPVYVVFVSKRINAPWPMRDTLRIASAAMCAGLAAFAVQYYLESNLVSLCVGVAVSIVAYVAILLVLKVVKTSDLDVLKQVEKRLPSWMRTRLAFIWTLAYKCVD